MDIEARQLENRVVPIKIVLATDRYGFARADPIFFQGVYANVSEMAQRNRDLGV